MITRAQARTVIRALLDDEAKRTWSDAALDVLCQMVIDEQWSEVMDEAPWFASQLDTVVADSNGLVDLTSAGPLSRRFFKIQKLTKDSFEFYPTHPRDFVIQTNAQITAPDKSYYPMGGKLYAFPLDSGCTYEIRYNYLPTAFTSIGDNINVTYVDGFENAFIFETAARAMVKGGKDAIALYQTISNQTFLRLKGKTKREYVGPAIMQDQGDPIEFGGT